MYSSQKVRLPLAQSKYVVSDPASGSCNRQMGAPKVFDFIVGYGVARGHGHLCQEE